MPVDRGNAAFGIRHVVFQRRDTLPDEQAVPVRDHADEPDTPAGKVEHLRGTGIQDQLLHVLAHQLLGADSDIDRNRILREQLHGVHVLGGANSGNLGRGVEQRVRDLAGDHVDLVHVRQGDDDVGVVGAGTVEHLRIGRMADDGADIKPVLELSQNLGTHVDDGDLVGLFARQMVGGGRANLTCTEY